MLAVWMGGRYRLGGVWLLGCVCVLVFAVSAAGAQAATLFAYANGAGTPGGCAVSTPASAGCSLARALSSAVAGDTVKLETPGSGAGGTDFVGNWSIGTSGTSAAERVTIDGGDVSGATLNGNNGSAAGCTTAACNGPVLSVTDDMFLGVENVRVVNAHNSDTGVGGGVQNDHGGTVTIAGSAFVGNTASDGGAVDNGDLEGSGSVTITGSSFMGNTAGRDGGAVDNGDTAGSGSVTITGSSFTGNTAGGDGGAVDNGDLAGSGSVTITGSVFAGNTAGVDGGAVDNGDGTGAFGPGSGSVSIADSTFSADTAGVHGGEVDTGDGGDGVLVVSASTFDAGSGSDIVAGTDGGTGQVFVAGNVFAHGCQQAGGSWTDRGYELGADTSCFERRDRGCERGVGAGAWSRAAGRQRRSDQDDRAAARKPGGGDHPVRHDGGVGRSAGAVVPEHRSARGDATGGWQDALRCGRVRVARTPSSCTHTRPAPRRRLTAR